MRLRFLSCAVLAAPALLVCAPFEAAAQVCAARATVRQMSASPNEDGTRTLRYRAHVQADREAAACTRVSFTVMRSYVGADGATREEGIPLTVEVKDQLEVDGEDVLATKKLVYWWTDRVTCEPCAGEPVKVAAIEKAAAAAADDLEAEEAAKPLLTPKKKKILGALTLVFGVLLVL
jgi:hypothetical protein